MDRTPAANVTFDTGGPVQPNQATTLRFTVTDARSGQPTYAEEAHEAEMHLIVVSRDLGYFSHVHPQRAAQTGVYEITHTFPAPGDYVLYDEFELEGYGDEVHHFDLQVGGQGSAPAQLRRDISPKLVNGYDVSIRPTGDLRAGQPSGFVVTVTRDGQPVTDLEP